MHSNEIGIQIIATIIAFLNQYVLSVFLTRTFPTQKLMLSGYNAFRFNVIDTMVAINEKPTDGSIFSEFTKKVLGKKIKKSNRIIIHKILSIFVPELFFI